MSEGFPLKLPAKSTLWWPTASLCWDRSHPDVEVLLQLWQSDEGTQEWREVPNKE